MITLLPFVVIGGLGVLVLVTLVVQRSIDGDGTPVRAPAAELVSAAWSGSSTGTQPDRRWSSGPRGDEDADGRRDRNVHNETPVSGA
jgi:hypothetical protein